jgi:hypothetical protein
MFFAHVQRQSLSQRHASLWASYQYTWSTLAGSGRSVKSGYTILRASQVSYFVRRCRSMIRSCSRRRTRYVTRSLKPHSPSRTDQFFIAESHGRVSRSLRVRHQLTVVLAHFDHSFPEQDRCIQGQAPQGIPGLSFPPPFCLCSPCVPSGSPRPIFSRVHRRLGRQQGCQIYPLAIYAGEPCTTKRVPPVRSFLVSFSNFVANVHGCSITQATDTSNIRLVFITVRETILQNALKESGIL